MLKKKYSISFLTVALIASALCYGQHVRTQRHHHAQRKENRRKNRDRRRHDRRRRRNAVMSAGATENE